MHGSIFGRHSNLKQKKFKSAKQLIRSFQIDHLYIPRLNTEWLQANFPNDKRFASIIFVADNVLTPEVIQVLPVRSKGPFPVYTSGPPVSF